jgi:hypothetical protein
MCDDESIMDDLTEEDIEALSCGECGAKRKEKKKEANDRPNRCFQAMLRCLAALKGTDRENRCFSAMTQCIETPNVTVIFPHGESVDP